VSGELLGTLRLVSNDPDESPFTVPVSLAVIPIPQYICGDVNGDENGPSVDDLTYLVDFLFRGGPEPPSLAAADMNSSGASPAVDDITYLVAYLFQGGPAPTCTD